MNFLKKLSLTVVASALFVGSAVGTSTPTVDAAAVSGKVAVDGSTALLPLTQQAVKEFMQKNPTITVTATGSSSAAGAQAASKGTVQIGATDWDASKNVPGFSAFPGLVPYKIAVIPFATIVNKNVTVSNLTRAQLQGIFSGKISNWKQVGGKNASIIVVNRATGSGSRVNYQMKALNGTAFMNSGANYKEVKKSGDMLSTVSNTPNAIGYIDLVYVNTNVVALKFNGVAPTVQNVLNKTYPLWSYGYYMTKGQATGATQAFINYVLSPSFQQGSLKKMNFIPVSSMK